MPPSPGAPAGKAARAATRALRQATPGRRGAALHRLIELVENDATLLETLQNDDHPGLDRLRDAADHDDPLDTPPTPTPDQAHARRERTPLGVLLAPARTAASGLTLAGISLRTGNAILWAPHDATNEAHTILDHAHQALQEAGLPREALQRVDDETTTHLLDRPDLVDAVLPLDHAHTHDLHEHARMPLLAPTGTVCHTYIDGAADPDHAIDTTLDAIGPPPLAPTATTTVLVHEALASATLPPIVQALDKQGITTHAGEAARRRAPTSHPATRETWTHPHPDAIGARIVGSLQEAIQHVNEHGSGLADAILSHDQDALDRFHAQTDTSLLVTNAPTRNAHHHANDHAALTLNTHPLPTRGPLHLDDLTTTRWHIAGQPG